MRGSVTRISIHDDERPSQFEGGYLIRCNHNNPLNPKFHNITRAMISYRCQGIGYGPRRTSRNYICTAYDDLWRINLPDATVRAHRDRLAVVSLADSDLYRSSYVASKSRVAVRVDIDRISEPAAEQ